MANKDVETIIEESLRESARVKLEAVQTLKQDIAAAAELIGDAILASRKLLVCGNGGSAGDAQHMVGEFIGRFRLERKAFPAIALNVNTSVITAIGNDYGFDRVFARQVEAFAVPGDVLIGISTSGQSPNVALAMEKARCMGCRTIALVGSTPGRVGLGADVILAAPSTDTPRIQECHIATIHIICDLVEQRVASELAKEGQS